MLPQSDTTQPSQRKVQYCDRIRPSPPPVECLTLAALAFSSFASTELRFV